MGHQSAIVQNYWDSLTLEAVRQLQTGAAGGGIPGREGMGEGGVASKGNVVGEEVLRPGPAASAGRLARQLAHREEPEESEGLVVQTVGLDVCSITADLRAEICEGSEQLLQPVALRDHIAVDEDDQIAAGLIGSEILELVVQTSGALLESRLVFCGAVQNLAAAWNTVGLVDHHGKHATGAAVARDQDVLPLDHDRDGGVGETTRVGPVQERTDHLLPTLNP